MQWEISEHLSVDENGNVCSTHGAKVDERVVQDELITALAELEYQLDITQQAKQAVQTALVKMMEAHNLKEIETSDGAIRASYRTSTYKVQNVHDLATDLQSRADEIPKEVLLELIHAAKGFDEQSISDPLMRNVLVAYTEKRQKKPYLAVSYRVKRDPRKELGG